MFRLSSPAFKEGETIPVRYTCDGPDLSPPLEWTDPPAGTRAFVLICDDPDAPRGTWVHWVWYDIPPELRRAPEGVPPDPEPPIGGKQGINDFRRYGYGGPCPPRGHGSHRYFFRLYALDAPTNLPPGATRAQVEAAMQGHVLASAQLMGRYSRR